jgi:broad specificity phosphatase PhoE
MKRRTGSRLSLIDYSGATAPEFHRLLLFNFESVLSVVVRPWPVKETESLDMVALLSELSPLATRLTLISHAATQAQRRAAFPLDEALEQAEIEKVAALAWRAPRAEQILSGPEHRARQTAAALGLSAKIADDLRDCDYGTWSGCSLNEIQAQSPAEVAAWLADPAAAPHGGESIVSMIQRIGSWLESQQEPGHVLAVTHPAVIRSAVICVLEAPPPAFWRIEAEPLSLTDLRFNGRTWSVRSSGTRLA